MVQQIKFEAWAISRALLPQIKWNMQLLLNDMKLYAEQISPTDTGTYIDSFDTKIEFDWSTLQWILENNDPKASWVETGFQRNAVNWHKWPPRNESTVIYTGVGANVQQRTLNKFIPDIPKRLWAQ